MKTIIFFTVLVFAIVGCGGPIVQPQTPLQQVVYAKATLEGANNSMADLLEAEKVSVDEAKWYQQRAELARDALVRVEKFVKRGEPLSGMEDWRLANSILLELNNYLMMKEGR